MARLMFLLERVDILLERRGELEAPPAMIEKIHQWAIPRFANTVFNAFMDADVEAPEGGHPLANKLVEDGAFKVKGWTEWSEDIKTDLSGWPYFEDEHDKVKKWTPFVTVKADKKSMERAFAEWRSTGFLTLYFDPMMKMIESWEVRDYEAAKKKLRRSIRHELQHMAQTLIQDYVQNTLAGLPKFRGNKADRIERFVSYILDYDLDDREFFPLLSDSIAEFRLLDVPDDMKSEAIRVWVSDDKNVARQTRETLRSYGVKTHSFFGALKSGDKRKWREAMKRFVTAVG